MTPPSRRWVTTADIVAVILSAGMVVALNLFIVAAILEAYANRITLPVGLGDNATQVLTGWGGGIIGIIGALVGYRVGRRRSAKKDETETDPDG